MGRWKRDLEERKAEMKKEEGLREHYDDENFYNDPFPELREQRESIWSTWVIPHTPEKH